MALDETGDGPADVAELLGMMPLAATLGILLDSASRREVRGRMDWSPGRCTARGMLHGGALMALADSLGGICAYLNLPPGALTATITSSGGRSGDRKRMAGPASFGDAGGSRAAAGVVRYDRLHHAALRTHP